MKGTKTGGRVQGTPNAITSDLRSWIAEIIDNNKDLFIQDLQAVDPEKRLQLFEKLFQYVIPKQTAQSIDLEKLSDAQLNQIIDSINLNENE